MKKLSITFIALMGMTFMGKAQQQVPALAKVRYSFSHVRDTLNRAQPYQEQMVLLIGKNASLFTSYDKIQQLNKLNEVLYQQAVANGGNITNVDMRQMKRRPVTYTDFYTFFDTKKAFVVEIMMMSKYCYEDSISTIKWQLSKDTATISGIACKKATAHFKGRNWIAWYDPALPFQSGPWKLNGLPGLIMTAYDERKDIQFEFAGFDKIEAEPQQEKPKTFMLGGSRVESEQLYLNTIRLPTNAIKATKDEVMRLRNVQMTNPEALINSQTGGTTNVRRVSGQSTAPPKRNILNNPMELPEQQ
ncbi:MAG: GLPGLI family protein [Pedobacter sp.]|nr:GLPGLI family protein [Pedobacter sp.]